MINNHFVSKIIFPLIAIIIVVQSDVAKAQEDVNYANDAKDIKVSIEQKQKQNQYKQYLKGAKNISDLNQNNIRTYQDNLGSGHQKAIAEIQSQKYQKHLTEFLPDANLSKFKAEFLKGKKSPINQLMIFISISMPKNSLIQYSEQANKAGGVLVLRGIINNSFKDTAKFILSLNKMGVRAIIDPLSFKNFNINHVPQVVVIKDGHGCKDGRCSNTPLHDKISGNISLQYALELISKRGRFSKKESQRFLKTLRG